MLFPQNITIIHLATIVLDVHDILQEHFGDLWRPGPGNLRLRLQPLRPTLLAGNLLKVHVKTIPKVSPTA